MSVKDAIRKQSKQKTVQNRTNRVNTKAKKYNKEVSKSDKAYIQGDLRKSSSMKAYGVRKALSDGQTVYGYGDDDIYTGGRKASNYKALQRGEKGVYETKYIKTRQTKDNPTVVKNADGSTSVYKSRYLTNKEKKNLDKYGDLKHRPNNIEKASKKIGSSVVKGLETLNKGQSAFLGGLKTIGDESQEMFFEPDKYKQTGGVKDTLSKLKTNIKDGWDKPTQSFGSIINEKMDKYESENDFKYSKAGRFNASASGLAMDVFNPYDLTPNVPVGTMLRGTGKSFTKVPTKVDADDVAKRLDKILDGKEISDIKKQHIIHKATQKANKMAGNINPNAMHGINIGNKELVSGQKVAEFADHLPMARTYNEIRHIIQKKKRGANLEDVIADVAKKKIGKSVDLVKPLTKTPLALQKEVYDTSTGFMPDYKARKEAKELDNGFMNKVGDIVKSKRPNWALDEKEINDIKLENPSVRLDNESLKEYLARIGFENKNKDISIPKNMFVDSNDASPVKSFDEQIANLLGLEDDVMLNTINNSDMSQLDNIPFSAFKENRDRIGNPKKRRVGNAPDSLPPYIVDSTDGVSDNLDGIVLRERMAQEKQMKEYMKKVAQENNTGKRVNGADEKPRIPLSLEERVSNFNNIFKNLNPEKLTKEQKDIIGAVRDIDDKIPMKSKKVLIDRMNDVFFGGMSVIDDNVKPGKLKKIEALLDEINSGKTYRGNKIKLDDRYTQNLLRDLTDPLIDKKYSMLGEKYQYKNFNKDVMKKQDDLDFKIYKIKEKGSKHGWSEQLIKEHESLMKQYRQNQSRIDARNKEMEQILKMDTQDFYKAYPDQAPKYTKDIWEDEFVPTPFEDIIKEYDLEDYMNNPIKNANIDDMIDKAYEEIIPEVRAEALLESMINKDTFKDKKEMDRWIQSEAMLRAEEMANRNHSGLERVNKAESQHIAKGNRQEVDIDVKTKRIKEMNDAVRQHRKKLDLKYIDLKNKDKNKSIVEAKKNLMKIVESKWNDELDSDAVSELYRQQFQYLDKLGVDRGSYLEKFKTYEKKMEMINKMKRDYLNKDEFDFADVPPMVKLDLQMLASRINKGESIEKIAKEVTDEFVGDSNPIKKPTELPFDYDFYNFRDKKFKSNNGDTSELNIMNSINNYLGGDYLDWEDLNPTGKFKTESGKTIRVKRESDKPFEPKVHKPPFKEYKGGEKYFANPDTGEKIDQPLLKINKKQKEKLINKIKNTSNQIEAKPNTNSNTSPLGDFAEYMQNSNKLTDSKFEHKEPTSEDLRKITESVNKFMGIDTNTLEGQLELPRPTTEEINKMAKDSDKKNPFLSLYDGLTKDFKSMVTVAKPGWHGANYIQNKVLNAQDIGIDALKGRKEAKNIFKGGEGSITNPKTGEIFSYDKLREILEETGLMDNGIMGDLKNNSGSNPLSKFFHDVVRPSGKNSISTFGGALQKNNDETYSKIQNVISHIKNGDEVFDAIDKSNKTLFDYDDLSKFEKDVMKRLIPFYAYGKKNTLNQAEYLMNDQRSFVKAMRGVKGFESAIPNEDKREIRDDESYLDDRVQLPFSKEQDGKKYDYMLNPKLPLQLKGSMDLGANPLIEPLLDIAKNEDFFGDEIEDKGKYYKDKVSGSFTPPLVKLMKKVEKSKKDDKEFKITPDILNYLLGISGNYY